MHVVAIQADKVEREWGGVDKHLDAVHYYPTEYEEDGKTVAWGGLASGRPIGTTRVLLEVNPLSGLPLFWLAAGGGDITVKELQAAWDAGIAVLCVQARARLPQDEALPCGPCVAFWDGLQRIDAAENPVGSFRRNRAAEAKDNAA